MKNYALILLLAILGLSSCNSSKMLSRHSNLLSQTAVGSLPPEDKLDVLATSFVEMMHDGLRFGNPKKGLAFVKSYGTQNKPHFDAIFKDVDAWIGQLNTIEAIALGLRMLNKPYIGKLIDLIPKFERKYQQVSLLMDMTKKLKGGLINAGAKKLGL